MILIGLISLVALISISSISASDSTYNNNHCYACNYSDCQYSNSCLCKDPNYKIITENETKIRNNNNSTTVMKHVTVQMIVPVNK